MIRSLVLPVALTLLASGCFRSPPTAQEGSRSTGTTSTSTSASSMATGTSGGTSSRGTSSSGDGMDVQGATKCGAIKSLYGDFWAKKYLPSSGDHALHLGG